MLLVVVESDDHIVTMQAGEMHFTACVFTLDSKGDGVYINRNEVGMTDCYAIRNQGNGFFFDGQSSAPSSSAFNGGNDGHVHNGQFRLQQG